jgi:uncharacterized membrane protein
MVEKLPGVQESFIEAHEEMAQAAFIVITVLGVLSAIILAIFSRISLNMQWAIPALLILSIIASGMIGWTAKLGGQIRHTEIRKNAVGVAPDSQQTGQKDKDDD